MGADACENEGRDPSSERRMSSTSSHALLRDELFGLVTAVVRARDEAEGLGLANTPELLAASVFTRDVGRALAFGRG